ncbi:DUF4019 domain-containing protein [Luteimonas aestuarii]|uniref:DUF4019 domain-containing protein n=1 Tax=Luteimonas aestuarii TaxID=453837 RepID=A0A4R5TVD8_9GAMM|nr:DUF4019 domain-containing protein [Luteimonas aestuarii]TDK25044.1 DUF4019 domain-containing protein [Luteimonas aestuarii]
MKMPYFLLVAALCLTAGPAFAQQPSPQAGQAPQLTEEQQAQLARQDAEMSQAALQVMQLVDANRIGEIWDGASPVMQQAVSKDDFVRQITSDRTALGAVSGRANPQVSRTQGEAGGPVPEGLYINVQSETTFANQPQPVRELVSFRLDDDRTWRVSGYTLR